MEAYPTSITKNRLCEAFGTEERAERANTGAPPHFYLLVLSRCRHK